MSLIIATGSNLNNPIYNLAQAKLNLSKKFHFIAESRIYRSEAVDYLDQPDFFNQALEFSLPKFSSPIEVMKSLLEIEKEMGRIRLQPKGPRIIDIDIIFWGNENIAIDGLIVPHPRWLNRSFVVRPLMELPFFQSIKKCFTIPKTFEVEAFPIN